MVVAGGLGRRQDLWVPEVAAERGGPLQRWWVQLRAWSRIRRWGEHPGGASGATGGFLQWRGIGRGRRDAGLTSLIGGVLHSKFDHEVDQLVPVGGGELVALADHLGMACTLRR